MLKFVASYHTEHCVRKLELSNEQGCYDDSRGVHSWVRIRRTFLICTKSRSMKVRGRTVIVFCRSCRTSRTRNVSSTK